MIDFRYHLVSIVSIFLALAVGIVLGAGPLKEDLGNTLTRELTQLRQDKTNLRTDLAVAQKNVAARDTWAQAVTPAVVAGTLSGRTVAVVVTPGADGGTVKNTVATLTAAGAKVGSTITLSDAWVDPGKRTFRDNLASQLATLVKVPGGASSPDSLPGAVLSRAILSSTDRATSRLEPGASQALDGLRTAELLDVRPDPIAPASGVVMVGGPVRGATGEDTAARLAGYVQLARALDAGGAGAVVVTAADSGDPTVAGQLVSAVRKDGDATKGVSTVDDPGVPMGQATLAQALAEQYAGAAGQYGVAADAKAVLPEPAQR